MGNLVHKGRGSFTHVENTIFFDHALSLKAKGIYCQIRSLENNEHWVFTIRGFAKLAKDGVDAVTAGIKELESAGYIVRARKRGEAGRFAKSEEALWITLDDPAMHQEVSDELKADGYAVISEFKRSAVKTECSTDSEVSKSDIDHANLHEALEGTVETRTGKAVSGQAVSGKATSGKPSAINESIDKQLTPINSSSSFLHHPSSKREGGKSKRVNRRSSQQYPNGFEILCAQSIKPIVAVNFKQTCYKLWQDRIAEGYSSDQIIEAYEAYAREYRERNGDDDEYSKNLARWLESSSMIEKFTYEPVNPTLSDAHGDPLSMEDLAKQDDAFAPLWRRYASRCKVVATIVLDKDPAATKAQIEEAIEADGYCKRCKRTCEERYRQYLASRVCVKPALTVREV